MNNFEPLEFILKRRLGFNGFSSERIDELLNEFTIEEMIQLGVFNKAKSLLKKTYEISESGKLLCLEITTVRKN